MSDVFGDDNEYTGFVVMVENLWVFVKIIKHLCVLWW
jgi:hypothetical protein